MPLDYEPSEAEWSARRQITDGIRSLHAIHGRNAMAVIQHAVAHSVQMTMERPAVPTLPSEQGPAN